VDAINRNIAVIGLAQAVIILGGQFVATLFISSMFNDPAQAPDSMVFLSKYGFVFVAIPLLWGLVAACIANARNADGARGLLICIVGIVLTSIVLIQVAFVLFAHMIHDVM
jgi:hypothetical protein